MAMAGGGQAKGELRGTGRLTVVLAWTFSLVGLAGGFAPGVFLVFVRPELMGNIWMSGAAWISGICALAMWVVFAWQLIRHALLYSEVGQTLKLIAPLYFSVALALLGAGGGGDSAPVVVLLLACAYCLGSAWVFCEGVDRRRNPPVTLAALDERLARLGSDLTSIREELDAMHEDARSASHRSPSRPGTADPAAVAREIAVGRWRLRIEWGGVHRTHGRRNQCMEQGGRRASSAT